MRGERVGSRKEEEGRRQRKGDGMPCSFWCLPLILSDQGSTSKSSLNTH
jgi:hypothetical protein